MPSASQTLQNLSVVPEGTGNEKLLMPKLQYRFRVMFSNFGFPSADQTILTRQVIDCARPQVQFDEITLNVYNSRVYLAGKHTWQTLALNVRDDATGAISAAVGAQLQKQLDFFNQSSATAGGNYKFDMDIQILDGGNGSNEPTVLEDWSLSGCFLQQANYQTLNYATSDAVTIAMTIRYDNAVQTDGLGGANNGVGGPTPGSAGLETV
jgi:hypothetical protein